jgi:hypothetical protein
MHPTLGGPEGVPIDGRFHVAAITLPTSDEYVGTWGSRVIGHPRLPLAILSLPRGASRVPLAVVNVATGETALARGLRGELRDALFEENCALLLTTHALCRVRLAPKPEVLQCGRPKGVGTYLWRLLDFGSQYVAVTGWASKSALVLRRSDFVPVKRLKLAGAQASLRVDDAHVRLLSFHAGLAVDYELESLRPVAQMPLPLGTEPLISDAAIYVLTGTKGPVDTRVPMERIWAVNPRAIARLDSHTYAVRRRSKAPRWPLRVLAIAGEEIVIATEEGIALVRASDFAPTGSCPVADEVWQHAFVPSERAVVMQVSRFMPRELKIVRWSAPPEGQPSPTEGRPTSASTQTPQKRRWLRAQRSAQHRTARRRGSMRHLRPLLLILVALCTAAILTTAACGGAPPASGVEGQVLSNGGPSPGDWPLANVKVEVHAGELSAPIVALVKADAKGRFRVALPPGRYTLIMHKYDDHYREPASVVVAAGVFASVRVMNGVK